MSSPIGIPGLKLRMPESYVERLTAVGGRHFGRDPTPPTWSHVAKLEAKTLGKGAAKDDVF